MSKVLVKYNWVIRGSVYISIIFLLFYLREQGFLEPPHIVNGISLALAIMLLMVSTYFQSIQWWYMLKIHNIDIEKSKVFIGYGLNVFGKYAPGKITTIVGRASLISSITKVSATFLGVTILQSQVYSILCGFLLGIFTSFFLQFGIFYTIITWALTIAIGMILFSRSLNSLAHKILSNLLRKEINLPFLSLKNAVRLFPYYIAPWLVQSIAFYFIVSAILPINSELMYGFIYPMASCYGIIMLFAPGGIGIREGVLVGLLTMNGVEPSVAVAISILQRLITLIIEVILFFISLFINRFKLTFNE